MSASRFEALIGKEKIELLKTRSVMVFGLGGVGSYAVEALARSGVGKLYLIDFDFVEASNINRQIIALNSTIGFYKTDVMKSRINDINPDIEVITMNERLTPDNIDRFLGMVPTWIVDAIDDVPVKILLIEKCLAKNQLIISSMGFANKFHPEMVEIALLSQTTVCPLAKIIRQSLKHTGVSLDVPVAYSKETPIRPVNEQVRLGSTAFVPATAGLVIAGFVIRRLIDLGDDAF